jgi:hypothetical protein
MVIPVDRNTERCNDVLKEVKIGAKEYEPLPISVYRDKVGSYAGKQKPVATFRHQVLLMERF